MRNRFIWVTVISLLIMGQTVGWAQKDTPASRMPCDKMLKMGADKYLVLADAQDGSTNGTVQAGVRYTDCRRQHNLVLERRLPKTRQQQIKTVRAALNSLSQTVYAYTIIVEGGGSMYRVTLAYDLANNEDTIAHLIALVLHPAHSRSSGRLHASADMAHAIRLFHSLKNPHADGPAIVSDDLKAYPGEYAGTEALFILLRRDIRLLPDAAATLLAHQVLTQIKDALSTSH